MGMGRRKEGKQESLFIASDRLLGQAGHPFYRAVNRLLDEAGFDRWLEERCLPYYDNGPGPGSLSIPPGVYFRMLLVGYFEGIESQRGIAWRCADSLSLRQFLGLTLDQHSPDHSTLTLTRRRLPAEVFEEVFQFMLRIAANKKLLSGKTVGVDSTTLEANAAMKSIVRKETGEDWRAYVTRLMREEGAVAADEEPTDEERRRFDKKREKKVSNDEWESSTDPAAKITKMKDGRTHLAYKAEHVVDLETEFVLAAEIRPATAADTQTIADSLLTAQANLDAVGHDTPIVEVAADKGYHAAATLDQCQAFGFRTYIPDPKRHSNWDWSERSEDERRAVTTNRQRVQRKKGRELQRQRSAKVERSFAHLCETGGMRRTWLRGLVEVSKRYLVAVAAHNLGRLMRQLFGIGKPRCMQGLAALKTLLVALSRAIRNVLDVSRRQIQQVVVSLRMTVCFAG